VLDHMARRDVPLHCDTPLHRDTPTHTLMLHRD
jgi:hypothetical protein